MRKIVQKMRKSGHLLICKKVFHVRSILHFDLPLLLGAVVLIGMKYDFNRPLNLLYKN